MKTPLRVLIVEDHFLARMALHGVLDAQPGFAIVGEAGTGQDAIRLYREHRPDVVIMDLKLNGVSGFDAIEAIHREHPKARILVLSNFQGSEDVYRALRCGARGYLTKDADRRQLIDAIQTVARGGRFIPNRSKAASLSAAWARTSHLERRMCSIFWRRDRAPLTSRGNSRLPRRLCGFTSAICWKSWAPATAPTRWSSRCTADLSTWSRWIFRCFRPA